MNTHVPSTLFCGFPYIAMLSKYFFLNHLKVDIMTPNPKHFSMSLKNWNICHQSQHIVPLKRSNTNAI